MVDLNEPAHLAMLRTHLHRTGKATLTEAPNHHDYGWTGGHAHRYRDPEPHLRLRIRLHDARSYGSAAQHVGAWEVAHTWLAAAADGDISAGAQATLFFGAPALAFALHAAADRPGRYERALESLDIRVAAITRRRLDQAHARIDRGDCPKLAEFDLIGPADTATL